MHPQRLFSLLLLQRRLAELLKHVLGGLDGGRRDGLFHELRPRLGVIQNEALQKQTVLMFTPEARDPVGFIDLQLSQGKRQQNDDIYN